MRKAFCEFKRHRGAPGARGEIHLFGEERFAAEGRLFVVRRLDAKDSKHLARIVFGNVRFKRRVVLVRNEHRQREVARRAFDRPLPKGFFGLHLEELPGKGETLFVEFQGVRNATPHARKIRRNIGRAQTHRGDFTRERGEFPLQGGLGRDRFVTPLHAVDFGRFAGLKECLHFFGESHPGALLSGNLLTALRETFLDAKAQLFDALHGVPAVFEHLREVRDRFAARTVVELLQAAHFVFRIFRGTLGIREGGLGFGRFALQAREVPLDDVSLEPKLPRGRRPRLFVAETGIALFALSAQESGAGLFENLVLFSSFHNRAVSVRELPEFVHQPIRGLEGLRFVEHERAQERIQVAEVLCGLSFREKLQGRLVANAEQGREGGRIGRKGREALEVSGKAPLQGLEVEVRTREFLEEFGRQRHVARSDHELTDDGIFVGRAALHVRNQHERVLGAYRVKERQGHDRKGRTFAQIPHHRARTPRRVVLGRARPGAANVTHHRAVRAATALPFVCRGIVFGLRQKERHHRIEQGRLPGTGSTDEKVPPGAHLNVVRARERAPVEELQARDAKLRMAFENRRVQFIRFVHYSKSGSVKRRPSSAGLSATPDDSVFFALGRLRGFRAVGFFFAGTEDVSSASFAAVVSTEAGSAGTTLSA